MYNQKRKELSIRLGELQAQLKSTLAQFTLTPGTDAAKVLSEVSSLAHQLELTHQEYLRVVAQDEADHDPMRCNNGSPWWTKD